MASPHTPPPSGLRDRLHLNSILSLISTVDQHIHRLLSDPLARKSLHLQCTTNLASRNSAISDFSDHSVISNLYWGINNLELAMRPRVPEDGAALLATSEKMLQAPALLEEDGSTLGVANRYIVCCTYFYLCLVGKLKGDEWQMTMHFMQSVLASPVAVKTEFAPELWRRLFQHATADETAMQQARRYKDWLMYYQVVSYGEAPPCNGERTKNYQSFGSGRCLGSLARELKFTMLHEDKMATTLEHHSNANREKIKVTVPSPVEQEDPIESKNGKSLPLLTYLDEDFEAEINDNFDVRCIQDMLEESQSESHTDSEDLEVKNDQLDQWLTKDKIIEHLHSYRSCRRTTTRHDYYYT